MSSFALVLNEAYLAINNKGNDQYRNYEISDGQRAEHVVGCPVQVGVPFHDEQEEPVAQEAAQDDDQVQDGVAPVGVVVRVNPGILPTLPRVLGPLLIT